MAEEGRENTVGTIEHTRKMLAFLKTLIDPSETAQAMIRQYEAEVKAYEKYTDPLKGFSSAEALRNWEIQG